MPRVRGGDRPSRRDLAQRFTTSANPPIVRVRSFRATSRRTVRSRSEIEVARHCRSPGPSSGLGVRASHSAPVAQQHQCASTVPYL